MECNPHDSVVPGGVLRSECVCSGVGASPAVRTCVLVED